MTDLEPVTVYATRSPRSTFDVPAIVSKIDMDTPGNALAGDMSDLLQFTPGVEVDNGPRRNGQTVSIRGFDGEAIITMIDGRRQNFEAAHDGRFYLDPSLLKSVEIVKGASTAIYGGGAIGGVIAFDTVDAADLLAPGESFGMKTSAGIQSASVQPMAIHSVYGRTGAWDILGSASVRASGDIKQGDGNELESADFLTSALIKVGYSIDDFNTVKFQYQGHRNDGREPNNGAGTITTSNPIVQKMVTDQQVSLNYAYENPDNAWFNPKVHVYRNSTEVEEKDLTGSNAGRVQDRTIETIGFTADNQTKLALGEGHKHVLSYGFEIYSDEQTGSSSTTGTRSGVPDAEGLAYGLYIQDEIALKPGFGDLSIIPAVRWDAYSTEDDTGGSQDASKASPKISVSYKPIEQVMVFGSWAKAFRAPNMTELYPSGQHYPGNNFIANTDLKPETVTTIEFGAGLNFRGILDQGDHARVKGSWFSSDGKNFISQEISGTTTQYINVPNAKLYGWEVEGTYSLNPVSITLGATFVSSRNDDTGANLDNNIPLTVVADINYKVEAIDSLFGLRGRFANANERSSGTSGQTDGYGVLDIYYRWRPDDPGMESMTVDLGIENLLDKSYAKRYATLRETGRNYVARVNYTW
tara:strand:- start:15501 stop:17417 length:1917 start_codon:yes stop_codon:yes gene_type:complete